jgi:hypothetical protein
VAYLFLVRFVRTLVCSILLLPVALGAASVPSDFEIRARFFPGAGFVEGGPNPWRLTIAADGTAIQDTALLYKDKTITKKRQLSKSDMVAIVTAFERARFFTLPKEMIDPLGGEPGHQMGITLKLTASGKTHTVTFSVPGRIRDRNAARRFWSAWSVVAQKVPSRNHNQEFNYWLHYNPL